jgi:hypothetical protein
MWTQSLQSPSDSDLRRRQGRLPRQPLGPVDRLVRSGGSWLTEKNRVFWSGSIMTSLFAEVALNVARVGEARAVNNSGEFVGSRKLLNSAGLYIPKAFRSGANGALVDSDDFLIPPPQLNVATTDTPSEALAISERNGSGSGIAVGWAGMVVGTSALRRPAVWWSRVTNQPQLEADWLDVTGGLPASTGQANAINSYGNIYGWVRLTASSEPRAARWEQGWKSTGFLDDQFEVYGYSDQWDLEEFVDATDKELILGNGKKNGSSRAFVLVPQAVAN